MIVDKPFSGSTYYEGFSKHLDSISELPPMIKYNLEGYLNRILGSMKDSLRFSHGQIVDLKRYFAKDSSTFSCRWIVPKYDLIFLLKDNSIGIKSYYLKIRLDEYGQILNSNWPKERYSEKSRFKQRSEIEYFALRQAKSKKYNTDGYLVDLIYNAKLDKLCWVFQFPTLIETNKKQYNAFEIPWDMIEIVDEYDLLMSTVE